MSSNFFLFSVFELAFSLLNSFSFHICNQLHLFIRIEKEIFPEYKDEEVFLLDVTWEEDYIQKLGEIQDIVIIVNFSW